MNFEKFSRPSTPSDLHFADPVVESQIKDIALGNVDTSLILYGPPGTGKSATAYCIATERNANSQALFSIDFVFEGKQIESTDEILNVLNVLLTGTDFPFIVINEFDQMKPNVQSNLHSFWNLHHEHCGLILTTNKYSSISPALHSRMPAFDIQCPPPEKMLTKAQAFLKSRGKTYSDDNVLKVLTAAGNDMRYRIRAIEQLAI